MIPQAEGPEIRAPHASALTLSPASGLGLVAVSAVLFFGGGLALAGSDPAWSLALLPFAAFLVPSLLYARLCRTEALVFPSSKLTSRAVVVASALSLGASLLALGIAGAVSRWAGPAQDEAFLMGFIARFPLFPRVLLFALLPGICEESLFRGALLASLRQWGPLPSCLASGLLFALFHGSLPRLVPVAVVGLSLAAVVWITGNVWLAAAGHVLHNLMILAALQIYGAQGEPSPKALAAWAFMGLLLIFAGILVARRSRVWERLA